MSTKDKILINAREEFVKRGYELASLRTITRRSEMSTNNIYNYFKSKEDLFNEVIKASGYDKLRKADYPVETAMLLEKYLSKKNLLITRLSELKPIVREVMFREKE